MLSTKADQIVSKNKCVISVYFKDIHYILRLRIFNIQEKATKAEVTDMYRTCGLSPQKIHLILGKMNSNFVLLANLNKTLTKSKSAMLIDLAITTTFKSPHMKIWMVCLTECS